MKEHFIPIRLGILDYLLRGEISAFEFGVYVIVHLQADYSTGIWRGSAPRILNSAPRGSKLRETQRALEHLTDLGLLRNFHMHGQRGNFPVLINKFIVRSGALKGMRLNAGKSDSWQHPTYELCAGSDADDSADVRAHDAAIQEVQEVKRENQNPAAASPEHSGPLPFEGEKPPGGKSKPEGDAWANTEDPLSVLACFDRVEERPRTDPRHKAVVQAFTTLFAEHNANLKAPFDSSDARQVQKMLREQPQASMEQLIQWLKNAFESDTEFPLRRGFRLREFCSHYTKFTHGPLRKFTAASRSSRNGDERSKYAGIPIVA